MWHVYALKALASMRRLLPNLAKDDTTPYVVPPMDAAAAHRQLHVCRAMLDLPGARDTRHCLEKQLGLRSINQTLTVSS